MRSVVLIFGAPFVDMSHGQDSSSVDYRGVQQEPKIASTSGEAHPWVMHRDCWLPDLTGFCLISEGLNPDLEPAKCQLDSLFFLRTT